MEVSSCDQIGVPPSWTMNKTLFGMYGTKRKSNFNHDVEPHDQFCPVAKKACPSTDLAMDDDCLPEMPSPAITNQPLTHQVPHMPPSFHQHESDRMGLDEEPEKQDAPKWISWQEGRLASWSSVVRSCQGGDNADTDRGATGEGGPCQGGGEERLGWGTEEEALQILPRVEIDRWSPTPDDIQKQLEKQVRTPELAQARQACLRARVDQLQSQLQYMKSMDVESNDYWALPQENHLKMEDELEQARIAMESDYVPDPFQYHCSDIPVPMAGHDTGSVNQVRCYCKPNWEGMLDPIGYI
ncbi:uncharacterized protein LOC135154552 [Lytechinus pictus]|uniref:uncharacterized protein LOC135154552 n=1 Tax=Lytechinus pictus TaxID=7653 RepID=UPI0030B9FC19